MSRSSIRSLATAPANGNSPGIPIRLPLCGIVVVGLLGVLVSTHAAVAESNWLAFRGDGGRGAALKSYPPVDFDVPAGKNVAWKTATTGRGIGGPLVIGDLVIVTGNDGEDQRDIHVEAFDTNSGERRWIRSLRSTGRPFTHPTGANASPTSVSDGERVFSLFSSCDLVCLTTDGQLQWVRGLALDHPKTGNDVSMSSSPAVCGGVVAVLLENQGDSFAAGIDAQTGETRWQIDRTRQSNWSSPQSVTLGDSTPAFVFQGSDGVSIVRASDGELLHRFAMQSDRTSSATFAPPMIIVPGEETTALRIDSTGVEVAWKSNRLRPQRCSPVVAGERIYIGRGSVLMGGTMVDGEVTWQKRLPGIETVWATPIATGSGIFVFDAGGNVAVVRDDGEDAEVIAQSVIGEAMHATPAVVGDAIYLRTDFAVVKIAS